MFLLRSQLRTFLLLLTIVLSTCDSSRILCIFPTPFHSHQAFFRPIWRALSERGHDVTVITTSPVDNLPKVRQIDLSFTFKLVYDIHNMEYIVNTEKDLLVLMRHVNKITTNLTIEQFTQKSVKDFIDGDEQYDLMIIEAHLPAWLGFAAKFNCPVIAITSMEPTNHIKNYMGNVNNPILTPHINLPFSTDQLSFLQRCMAMLHEIMERIQINFIIIPTQEKLAQHYLKNPNINLLEIIRNTSLVFVNIIPGFNRVAHEIPTIVNVHGLQIQEAKPLPGELQSFLDDAKNGTIYFCLGSNVKSYLLSKERKDLFIHVFSQLPYRVIWKFEGAIENLPDNIKVVAWAPQQDILRHRNVKLFITQGGIQSIEESIAFNVPILGIPFFGDQFFNIKRVEYLEIGSYLDMDDLSEETLRTNILATIDNRTFLENLRELSELLDDPTHSSLERAIWWIEYVLKYGTEHLKSPMADMPYYQYYLFDVILFVIGVLAMITIILKVLFGRFMQCLYRKKRNGKAKLE